MVKFTSAPRTEFFTALDRLVFKNVAVNVELTQRPALCYSIVRNDTDLYQFDTGHSVSQDQAHVKARVGKIKE